MRFTKLSLSLLALSCSSVLLTGCSTKPLTDKTDPAHEQAQLANANAQTEFMVLLEELKKADLSTDELTNLKSRFDQMASAHPEYLGARINSADIALRLGNLDDAQARYLAVLAFLDTPATNETRQANSNQASATQTNSADTSNVSISTMNHPKFRIHCANQLGFIARQSGQFEQAEAYYRQALALNPNQSETLKNLAILLDLYRGRLAEALPLYEQYQAIVGDQDPKIKDWIFDLKNRLPADETNVESVETAEEESVNE